MRFYISLAFILIAIACTDSINDRSLLNSTNAIGGNDEDPDGDEVVNPSHVTLFASIRNRCEILNHTSSEYNIKCRAVTMGANNNVTNITALPREIELEWSAPVASQGSIYSVTCGTLNQVHANAAVENQCKVTARGVGYNIQAVEKIIVQMDLVVTLVNYSTVTTPVTPPTGPEGSNAPNPVPTTPPSTVVRSVIDTRIETEFVTLQ